MLGDKVRIQFNIKLIDGPNKERHNADVFRLYELLKATLEVHSHDGFYLTGSGCQNYQTEPELS